MYLGKRIIPVSVVIPTYNRAELLCRALLSVFRQTVECEEILIIDDGSTDASHKSLAGLLDGSPGPEVRLFLKENRGPAAARNLGIDEARCETIAFLDSDDHWQKEKLAIQFGMMEKNPDYLISHTRERWLRRGQHLNQKKRHIPRHGDIFNQCLELCAVGMSTVMLKKKIFNRIGQFDSSMRCCEDYDFWLRTSCRYPFLLIDEALTIKEGGRDDQVSYQYRIGMDRLRIDSLLRLLKSGLLDELQERQTVQELLRKCKIFGRGCLKHGKTVEGYEILGLATTLESDTRTMDEIRLL